MKSQCDTCGTGVVTSVLFENLITFDELLVLLKGQYSKKTIYRWIRMENFPAKKMRGRYWFPLADVELWLERSSE